jgi:hypothetical protein
MFTPDDVITQFIETKDVAELAIRVPPQQPFGDDVSTLLPLRSSVPSALNHAPGKMDGEPGTAVCSLKLKPQSYPPAVLF